MRLTSNRALTNRVPLLVALGFAILPFVALSFFNHPQNDDYGLAVRARQLGFFGANAFWFNAWSARYVAHAVMSASPVVFGSIAAFKCMAALLIGLFAIATFSFVTAMVPGLSIVERLVGTLAILALHLLQMPTVAEGFFWGAGAAAYELGNVLLLLLLGLVLRGQGPNPRWWPRPRLVAAVLVIIAAAGTNEIAMLYMDGFLALALVGESYRELRLDHSLAVLLGVALLASAVVILAPGTRQRFALSNHPHDLVHAFRESFRQGRVYAWAWLTRGPVVPLAILFVVPVVKAWRRSQRAQPHPALSLALFAGIFFASFFPSLYSTGIMEPRTANIVQLYFVIGFLLNVANIAVWIAARRGLVEVRYPLFVRGLLWAAVLLLTIIPPSNLRTAYADLLSGKAARYDRERVERARLIARCTTSECDVPPLSDPPKTICFFEDAFDDGDGQFFRDYKDAGFAAYHGKKHIRLSRSGTPGGATRTEGTSRFR